MIIISNIHLVFMFSGAADNLLSLPCVAKSIFRPTATVFIILNGDC